MITIPKYLGGGPGDPVVCLVGLGNAGVNLADHVSMGKPLPLQVIAMNSDQQSLSSSLAPVKVVLGPVTTRGLGAGGDPEIGLAAARESAADIEAAISGSDIVFLCCGLGGGTGSGAAGMVAEIARQSGALLIAVLTSPFVFEGRRRRAQATAALREIRAQADAVVHFDNDRMAELTAPRSGVAETFSTCDALLGGCVSSLVHFLSGSGPMAVGLPDLLSVLRGGDAACLFGSGSATGDNRAHEALENAFKSPLLDHGRMLDEASSLLVHVSGPPGLSLAEVGVVMQEVARRASDSALLHLGISSGTDHAAPVVITLLGKCADDSPPAVARPQSEAAKAHPPAEPSPQGPLVPESAPPERPPKPSRPSAPKPAAAKSKQEKQETLQFEPVARGRFEKIEPTVIEGEDLDVPTFLRRTTKK